MRVLVAALYILQKAILRIDLPARITATPGAILFEDKQAEDMRL